MWRWLVFLDLGCSLSYSEFPITSAINYAISRACWLWNGCRFLLVPPCLQIILHSSPLPLVLCWWQIRGGSRADLVHTLPWSHALGHLCWVSAGGGDVSGGLGSGPVSWSLQCPALINGIMWPMRLGTVTGARERSPLGWQSISQLSPHHVWRVLLQWWAWAF